MLIDVYWLAWHIVLNGRQKRFWELKSAFNNLVQAWEASWAELQERTGWKKETVVEVVQTRSCFDLEKEVIAALQEWHEKGIYYLSWDDERYPRALRCIPVPPPGLFVRGFLPGNEQPAVAIVGTRRPTPYGTTVARRLAEDLARVGVVVVSGLARGIDAAAHKGALESGGLTVAVLGCGVDVVYPRENQRLFEEIAARGALISEYPPGTEPRAWHFPQRNRIISGLARCVVIVEAGTRSGALITADLALEQGKEVLAVPGNITSSQSGGPNQLIKQGAKPVLSAADIWEELGIELRPVTAGSVTRSEVLELDLPARRIYELLRSGPLDEETLVYRSGMAPPEVARALTNLELYRLVERHPGGIYIAR